VKRSLDGLGPEANVVLDTLLCALLEKAAKATGLSSAETVAVGRELIAAGAITIVQRGDEFSLRLGS
jgi:hypothetical protein